MSDNHKVYILKPGVTNISGNAAKDTAVPSSVDYIECLFDTYNIKGDDDFTLKRRPNQGNTIIGLNNISTSLVFQNWQMGKMPSNSETKNVWNALWYALGNWKKVTTANAEPAKSKMSIIYWYDGSAEVEDRNMWDAGSGKAVRMYGVIKGLEFSENFANNTVLKSLQLEIVFPNFPAV